MRIWRKAPKSEIEMSVGAPDGEVTETPGELVVPVLGVAVLVARADLDVAQDAVPLLPLGEAPGDRLGDDDRAVGVDANSVSSLSACSCAGTAATTACGRHPWPSPRPRPTAKRPQRRRSGRREVGAGGRGGAPARAAPGAARRARRRGTTAGAARRARRRGVPTGRRSLSPRRGGGRRWRGRPRGCPGARAGRVACRSSSCPWRRRARPWRGRP